MCKPLNRKQKDCGESKYNHIKNNIGIITKPDGKVIKRYTSTRLDYGWQILLLWNDFNARAQTSYVFTVHRKARRMAAVRRAGYTALTALALDPNLVTRGHRVAYRRGAREFRRGDSGRIDARLPDGQRRRHGLYIQRQRVAEAYESETSGALSGGAVGQGLSSNRRSGDQSGDQGWRHGSHTQQQRVVAACDSETSGAVRGGATGHRLSSNRRTRDQSRGQRWRHGPRVQGRRAAAQGAPVTSGAVRGNASDSGISCNGR
ncbi:hypothetical protein EVAR_26407_1 [Eumeta japonica]|uniref:Uncharacterized protein n=1 Tax=Eumeta variegata TaxID=151549 RepID=A0A4C1VSF3_EUMVA|nr:hypothetical protein EVAR_26407_1 [Eumeta japonica]